MSNLNEMVKAAQDRNPAKFEELFESIVMERLGEALVETRADIVAEMFGISESQKMKSILDVNFLGFNREDLEAILRVDYPGTRVLKVHGKGKVGGRAGQIIYKVDISDDTVKDVETANIYLMFNARTGRFEADF